MLFSCTPRTDLIQTTPDQPHFGSKSQSHDTITDLIFSSILLSPFTIKANSQPLYYLSMNTKSTTNVSTRSITITTATATSHIGHNPCYHYHQMHKQILRPSTIITNTTTTASSTILTTLTILSFTYFSSTSQVTLWPLPTHCSLTQHQYYSHMIKQLLPIKVEERDVVLMDTRISNKVSRLVSA